MSAVTILFISICLVRGHPITQHGYPAYVEVEYPDAEVDITHHTVIKFKAFNLLFVFIIMSIPVFIAGYVWKKPDK